MGTLVISIIIALSIYNGGIASFKYFKKYHSIEFYTHGYDLMYEWNEKYEIKKNKFRCFGCRFWTYNYDDKLGRSGSGRQIFQVFKINKNIVWE